MLPGTSSTRLYCHWQAVPQHYHSAQAFVSNQMQRHLVIRSFKGKCSPTPRIALWSRHHIPQQWMSRIRENGTPPASPVCLNALKCRKTKRKKPSLEVASNDLLERCRNLHCPAQLMAKGRVLMRVKLGLHLLLHWSQPAGHSLCQGL